MARRLVEYGHKVDLITSYRSMDYDGDDDWFVSRESGIQVHWLPVPYSNKMNYDRRIKAFMKFAWKAAGKAASLDCDLIFATSTPLTIALPAVYAARKQKVPMIFEVRDLWPELPIAVGALKNPLLKWAARWLERFAYFNSERIIALSPGMKEGIVKTGYPEEKVEIIPNSCDIYLFRHDSELKKELRWRYHWLQDRPLVIYTGTLGVMNGVDYMARLAGEVWQLNQDIRFVVIGDGKEKEGIVAAARNEGILEKNFFLLPRIAKNEIAVWLAAADMATSLFVDLEAMWANSANKFFDSLAAGTPIAINYGGWQKEILEESEAGLVLDPVDISASARWLVEKLGDPKWLSKTGQAAEKLARERFDRDKLAKQFEAVLLSSSKEN